MLFNKVECKMNLNIFHEIVCVCFVAAILCILQFACDKLNNLTVQISNVLKTKCSAYSKQSKTKRINYLIITAVPNVCF